MTCSLCAKTALTMAGQKGFCKEHRKEAELAMRALGDRKIGKGDQGAWTVDRR